MVMFRMNRRGGTAIRERVTPEQLRAEMRRGVVDLVKVHEAMGDAKFEEYLWMLRRHDDMSAVAEALGPDFFPNITLDAAHKAVIRGYETQPQDWRKVCRAGNAPDFKVQNRIAASELPDFPIVGKSASYRAVTLTDEKANYSIQKRGYIFNLDLETRANDDLGQLADMSTKFGRAYARSLDRFFFNLNLQANPTIYDGVSLFHANHANIQANGGTNPINAANVEASITKMQQQKGRLAQAQETATGGDEIFLVPRWLVCRVQEGPAAVRLLATMRLDLGGVTTGVVEPGAAVENAFVRGLIRGVIATPYLTTAQEWYLLCDPVEFDTFEMGFWRGIQEPQVLQEMEGSSHQFETDASRVRVRGVWGGAWLDFRTAVKATV